MDHRVVHFEIPADDLECLKSFYTDLFGWKIEGSPEMPDYLMVMTGEGPGIDGGIMKRKMPQQALCNYVEVESVDEYAAKLTQLGGQVVTPKMAVPKMGYFVVGIDPEGNPLGLWQTDPNAA
jgi:predicted enzyme related to lactoylglutathione lyase